MYIGEVRLFGFNFCPTGWLQASGQTLAVNQYSALFSLYGTIYGGNGQTNFMLPNLNGRAPYDSGAGASRSELITGRRKRRSPSRTFRRMAIN